MLNYSVHDTVETLKIEKDKSVFEFFEKKSRLACTESSSMESRDTF